MDPIGLIRAGLETAALLMKRYWGDQTSAESSLRKHAEVAADRKKEAYWKWREANRNGDRYAQKMYHDAYTGWSAELKRLHDQSNAER